MDRQLQTLCGVDRGRSVLVTHVASESGDIARLRELGIDHGRRLRVVQLGDPIICQVGECRIGLCRRLARCVYVDDGR